MVVIACAKGCRDFRVGWLVDMLSDWIFRVGRVESDIRELAILFLALFWAVCDEPDGEFRLLLKSRSES